MRYTVPPAESRVSRRILLVLAAIAALSVLVLTSAVYDLVTVEADVRDHNERIRQRVGLAPWISSADGGAGVAIRVGL